MCDFEDKFNYHAAVDYKIYVFLTRTKHVGYV